MQIQYTDQTEFVMNHYITSRASSGISALAANFAIGSPISKKTEAEKNGVGQLYVKAAMGTSTTDYGIRRAPRIYYHSSVWIRDVSVSSLSQDVKYNAEQLSGYANTSYLYLNYAIERTGSSQDTSSIYELFKTWFGLTGSV